MTTSINDRKERPVIPIRPCQRYTNLGDDKPTNKGTPNGALRNGLVEMARNSVCER